VLTFVGLGLFDEEDVSVRGLKTIENADVIYAEFYTSKLVGTTIERLEKFYKRKIHIVTRAEVEQAPDKTILRDARHKNVVLLTAGDAMISTTHVALRIEAADQGIITHIVHGASIATAVCGLTGLQNYRFGKSATIAFPYGKVSETPYNTVVANLRNDLHTLLFLDIGDEFMTLAQAVELLLHSEHEKGRNKLGASLAVGVARAGSNTPIVKADALATLKEYDLGPPPHVLVIPASLHVIEKEALETFAGAKSAED
jgi:diphthine synthase